MSADHQRQGKTKLTIEIDQELYNRVTAQLHHGQLSHMVRRFMSEIDQMLVQGDRMTISNWLYLGSNLNLRGKPQA